MANIYSENMFDFCIDIRKYVRYNAIRTNVREQIFELRGDIMNERCELRIRRNKIRRKKQLIKRYLLLAATLIIISLSSIFVFSFNVKAESSDSAHYIKYFKSVVVTANDSLWAYANDNAIDSTDKYIKEVKRINHLDSDEIYVGMNLIIPYYLDEFIE